MSLLEFSIQQDLEEFLYEQEILSSTFNKAKKWFDAAKEKVSQFVEFMRNAFDKLSELIQSKIRSISVSLNEKLIRQNWNRFKHIDPRTKVKGQYNGVQEFYQVLGKEFPSYLNAMDTLQKITATYGDEKQYFDKFNEVVKLLQSYILINGEESRTNSNFKDKVYQILNVSFEIDDPKTLQSKFDQKLAMKVKINIDDIINKVKESDKLTPEIKKVNRSLEGLLQKVNEWDKKHNYEQYLQLSPKVSADTKLDIENRYNSLYSCLRQCHSFGVHLITYIKTILMYCIKLLNTLASEEFTRILKRVE